MIPDIIALPWEEGEKILQGAHIEYTIEIAKSVRDFFPVDSSRMYVIRQREAGGKLCVTLAAKQMPVKEV
ncbi:MAG: aliphatic sulfonate ABC transporter [Selenomonas sp.]|nr:aliphatic sulfonate ABC transporter [Selenomonas sp.]